VDAALGLITNLWRFWQMRGYLVEGYGHARAVLAAADTTEASEIVAGALEAAGGLAYWLGDESSIAYYEAVLAIHQARGDRSGEARQWYNLAGAYTMTVDRATGLSKAREAAERAVDLYRELGDEPALGRALWAKANSMYQEREWAAARATIGEGLPLLEAAGDRFMLAWGWFMQALSYIVEGQADRARERLEGALREFYAVNDVSGLTLVLDGFSQLEQAIGNLDEAARLAGFVSRLETISGTGLNAANRQIMGLDPTVLRDAPATAAAWSAGEHMTVDEAVALALSPRSADTAVSPEVLPNRSD
jgi:hypothetical protein